MPELTVEIVNKVSNISALAEEKAALASTLGGGGGFSPLGGGSVSFGGSLTKAEQTMAANQLALIETTTAATAKSATTLEGYASKVRLASAASGEFGAAAGGLTNKLGALSALGFTPVGAAILGGVVALGAAGAVMENVIDKTRKDERANKDLAQAFDYLGEKIPTKEIDDFITKNEKYLPSIEAAKEGFASLARAGFDATMQQRLMGDAVNLAAVKNEDLGTAVSQLIKAHGGSGKALLDLGIVMKNVTDPQKNLTLAHKDVAKATKEHTTAVQALEMWELKHHDRSSLTAADLLRESELKGKAAQSTKVLKDSNQELSYAQALVKEKGDKFQALLDVLEPKIKGGAKTTDDLQQQQDKLNIEWEKFATKVGPPLLGTLSNVVGAVGDLESDFNNINWKPFLKGWNDDVVTPLENFFGMLNGWGNDWNSFVKMLGGSVDGPVGNGGGAGRSRMNTAVGPPAALRQRGFTGTFGKGGQ